MNWGWAAIITIAVLITGYLVYAHNFAPEENYGGDSYSIPNGDSYDAQAGYDNFREEQAEQEYRDSLTCYDSYGNLTSC